MSLSYLSRKYDLARLKIIGRLVGNGSVLDIGHAQQPNEFLPVGRCTGFDLERDETETYAEQIQGDIKNIDEILHRRIFRTVVAAENIQHVEDPYAFVRSARKLIDSDGQLIISTPNPVAFPTLLFEWARSHSFFYTEEHKYYFSPRWVERILLHCGFLIDTVKPVGMWPLAFPRLIPSAWSYQVVYVARPNPDHGQDPG